MKEASGCPLEVSRTPSHSGYCLPTHRGPVLSLAARASGQGTLALSWQLFLCAHGNSRSALPVVAAEGLWLIRDSPVCNLLGRQFGMEKQPAPGTGHILPQHSNPKLEEINENPERVSELSTRLNSYVPQMPLCHTETENMAILLYSPAGKDLAASGSLGRTSPAACPKGFSLQQADSPGGAALAPSQCGFHMGEQGTEAPPAPAPRGGSRLSGRLGVSNPLAA